MSKQNEFIGVGNLNAPFNRYRPRQQPRPHSTNAQAVAVRRGIEDIKERQRLERELSL